MSVNAEGNISQINAGNNWFQNVKASGQQDKEKAAPQPQAEAVKVSISQEGIENYRKQFRERGMDGANGKVIIKGEKDAVIRQAKRATSALSANDYGNALARETEKLKGKRTDSSSYSLSDRAEDSVRAYGNLYDEIVQGYQNGTRERYVEDETSETGYRKLTMEEELDGLDKAFQKAADGTDVEEMIAGEFKRLSSKAGSRQASFSDSGKKTQAEETAGQKMKKLAQAWKDTYKASGSKESGMEKALSMLKGMFGIRKEV